MLRKYTSIYAGHKLVVKPRNAYEAGKYIKFEGGRFDTADEKEQAFLSAFMKKMQNTIYDITDGVTQQDKESNSLKAKLAAAEAELAKFKGKKGPVSSTPNVAAPAPDSDEE